MNTSPEVAVNVPPFLVQLSFAVITPAGAVNIPSPSRAKSPPLFRLMSEVASPPVKVPETCMNPTASNVISTPLV